MSGQRTPVERLADDVVRADLAAQSSIRARAKSPPIGAGQLLLGPPGRAQRNWRVIGLVVLVVVTPAAALAGFALTNGRPAASPTSVAAVPSQTGAGTSAGPVTSPATSVGTTPVAPASSAPVIDPSVSGPPVTEPPQSVPDAAVQPRFIDQQVSTLTNGTVSILDSFEKLLLDGTSDTYLPDSGAPALADQPYIDLFGASAFLVSLGAGPATALSSHACGTRTERDELIWHTACNQPGPMPAGQYVVAVSYWARPIPEPFPQTAQCVYIVQADVDDDRATGFQSQLPYNHLIGADVYFENLFFWDQDGNFRNYILATDHALPPRSDTGQIHGNRPTVGRWFASRHAYDSSEVFVQSAWIPVDGFGDALSIGGFCTPDRATPGPEAFSVDALGHPGAQPFPTYFEVAGLP